MADVREASGGRVPSQRLQSVVNQPMATAHIAVLRERKTFGSHRLRRQIRSGWRDAISH
jgi:hypothetical protein